MSNPSAVSSEGSFVQLATVLHGTRPLADRGVNDSFRGQLILDDRTIKSAIIKDLNPKELANELMAAALAFAMGLPVPGAHLAKAPSGTMIVRKGPTLPDGARLVFGSADVKTPPVAQLYHGAHSAAILKVRKRLAEWKGAGSLYGFDSWTANIDRHTRNLLFSGDKEVWLIDHGHCFTGPKWKPADLDPSREYRNKLKAWLTPAMSSPRKSVVATEAAVALDKSKALDLKNMGQLNYVLQVLEGGDFNALISFLKQRRAHAPRLAATALGFAV